MNLLERAELRRQLTRLADGDRSAFDAVFAAALPPVRRLARRMLGNDADADDAAQDAMLKVFARAADYDPDRDALPWILGIAAYECRTLRQKRARRRELPDRALVELASDAVGPEEHALSGEIQEALAEVMGMLSPSDVETILASIDRERRGALAIATTAFRKRLQRALERLRAAWSTRHG